MCGCAADRAPCLSARRRRDAGRSQGAQGRGRPRVVLGEDIAYGRSTYLSPADLQSLYWPELDAVVRDLHALVSPSFSTPTGISTPFFPTWARAASTAFKGWSRRQACGWTASAQRSGPGITLWGNLSFDLLRASRSPDEIQNALSALPTRESRFILGSAPGLVHGMKVETVRRVYSMVS